LLISLLSPHSLTSTKLTVARGGALSFVIVTGHSLNINKRLANTELIVYHIITTTPHDS
jgi:hypothetical protein